MAKSRRSRIDDVLEQHAAELDSLTGTETSRVLQAYEDSRRELRERLAEMQRTGADKATPFTAQQVRVALAQVEAGVASLRNRMGNALGGAERKAHDLALRQLIGTVKTAEPTFRDAGGKVELAALRRLAAEQGLALHRYSVDRYGAQLVEAIQRQIVLGVTQGMTARQIADRIAGTDQSVFAGMRGRAELIARMELNRASNTGAQLSLEELAALDDPDTDDPLLKKADEFLDARNHPFSRVLHGRAVLPLQEWEVPIGGGKARGGLVWTVTRGIAHGFNYPAHFGERGRQIPWRASWGGEKYVPQRSFRERGLKKADIRGLRAIGRGEEPKRLSQGGRRALELSGFIDGQGRLLPAGRQALSERGANGRQTWPSLKPDPARIAEGERPKIKGDADKKRALRRQIETADTMSRAGWKVRHRLEKETGKNPDLEVEGRIFDVYAPSTDNPRNMASYLEKKVAEEQAKRFIVNLDDSPASIDDVRKGFDRDHWSFKDVGRAVEVILQKGDTFVRVLG